jgi:hypothetical protein
MKFLAAVGVMLLMALVIGLGVLATVTPVTLLFVTFSGPTLLLISLLAGVVLFYWYGCRV